MKSMIEWPLPDGATPFAGWFNYVLFNTHNLCVTLNSYLLRLHVLIINAATLKRYTNG